MSIEIIVACAVLAILLLIVLAIYNGIIKRKNSVHRAWSDVITQERQKNKIIPMLESAVSQYKEFEQGLQTRITELRASLSKLSSDKIDATALANAESSTAALMKGIQVAVENYPDLKAAELFNNLMREISEQQENIGAAIRIFNKNVEDFNNGIQVFPNSLVNSMLNKEMPIEPFTDSEALSGFEYKPNM